MSCGIPNIIANLIDRVIKNHETDWLGRQLERQGYLSYEALRAIRDDPSESWRTELEDAMFRLYAQVSPFQATVEAAHSDGMASIVNQLVEEAGGLERVEPGEGLRALVKQALHRLDTPLYQKPSSPQGLNSTLANLQEAQRGLLDVKEGRAKDLRDLQSLTMTGWASVERLLEITIRFYVRHFSAVSVVADQLLDSFKRAVEKKSLGPLLHGFAAVDSIFRFGEPESERRERENQRRTRLQEAEREVEDQIIALRNRISYLRRLGRSPTEIGAIEEQIHKIQSGLQAKKDRERDQEARIIASKRSLASSLRAECRRDFGCDNPFEGFVGIKERDSIPPRYRNDYAHLTFAEIYEKYGLRGALAAVEKALNLVTDLKVNRIAPETVILVGLGQDCYGRELIYFIDECAIGDEDGHIVLDRVRAMYKEHSFYVPFGTCLMFARKDEGNICNPIIYYLSDVMV